jgi:hypothetical protein
MLLILALGLIFGAAQLFAQSTVSGAISGTVKDPQGGVVPNASITVTNIATNATTTVNATDDGNYRVSNLNPGTYRVETTVSGFAPTKAENVVVEVGRTTTYDIGLTLGTATAEVNVSAEAPVINTTDPANATNINQTSISELPINGRRASDFARLTPGVNPDGDFGLNSFRGLSSLLNNSTLDGTDNNNTFFSEERGRTRIQYSVSQAAVREFQVNSTNYSAEYGRAAGGVINTVTKSGTNDFHGELFFFDRNNKWGSRNPSATLPTATGPVSIKPKDVRYQFGGAVGGPIIKDKLFFFFTYDQQHRNFPGVATPQSATAFNNFAPTGVLTQSDIDTGLTFLRSLTGEVPREQNQRIIFPKIDWNLNGRNTVSASYNYVRTKAPNGFQTPSVVNVGNFGFGNDFVSIDTFTTRVTSTLSSSLVNEFRFQFGREFARAFLGQLSPGEQALAGKASTTLFNGLLPSITITGTNFFQFGTSANFQRNAFPDERTIQFADVLNYATGNHAFKFGTDIKFTRDFIDNLRTGAGAYSYSSVANFIIDFTHPGSKNYTNYQQGFGQASYTIKTPDYAFFIQDDWRVNRRLTLNLGLRYDYQSFGKPLFPNASNAVLAAGQNRYSQQQADAIIAQTRTFPSDKNNFGPRLGFAWDITGDGKTSLRGGYGIFYGRIPNTFLTSPAVNTAAPGSQLNTGTFTPGTALFDANGNPVATPSLPNVLASIPARSLSLVVMSPDLQNPMIHEGDVILEREVAQNTAVSVSYIFAIGRDIPQFPDLNLPNPVTRSYQVVGGPLNGLIFDTPFFGNPGGITTAPTGQFGRPISNFGSIIQLESTSRTRYNALVLQLNRRLTKGLQFQTNYTFAHATDLGQQAATFAPSFPTVSNPFNRSIDEGRSDFDIRHHFVASAVWQVGNTFGLDETQAGKAIFGGFTVSPIVNISSGRPVTPFVSYTPSGGVSSGLLGSGGPQRAFFLARGLDSRPTTATVDLRLSKRIRFTENMNLELLAEGFNIFNRSNFTGISDTYFSATGQTSAANPIARLTYNAGTPTLAPYLTPTTINNTLNFSPRQIQLGLRFHF